MDKRTLTGKSGKNNPSKQKPQNQARGEAAQVTNDDMNKGEWHEDLTFSDLALTLLQRTKVSSMRVALELSVGAF